MQQFYDYKKYAILYVDDEEKSLKYFIRAFEPHFRILTATNAQEGFRLFEEHKDDLCLLMTDQRMPGEKGVQLLEKARQLRPKVIRILATAYSDMDAAIDAVNSGAIYKYITKPWDIPQLETTLRRGIEFFLVQQERDNLMREKLSVLHNMMITDRIVSLGILASGLGHHIRNSLVAVRTFLDLAPSKLQEENVHLDELRNPNFWNDFYEHVQRQIQRVTEMLSDLGVSSTPAVAVFSDEVSLKEVLAEAESKVKGRFAQKNITVDNQVPDNLPKMHVDGQKFARLFELLLADEAVSLPDGSRVTLKASTLASSSTAEACIQLDLSDNGPGLPAEKLRSIFDPFFVRVDDPQEFGINLMTCYFLIYHHGGSIEVKSSENGNQFLITMPVHPQTRPAAQEEKDFLSKVLMNETLWERLLAGS